MTYTYTVPYTNHSGAIYSDSPRAAARLAASRHQLCAGSQVCITTRAGHYRFSVDSRGRVRELSVYKV